MLIMFKVSVTAAGTPGPILGDNVNTIVTSLWPLTLTQDSDSMGKRSSIYNVVTASGRVSYAVARIIWMGAGNNTNVGYLLPRGTTLNSGRRVGPFEEAVPIGFGQHNDIDLGDFDVDAAVSGEVLVVWAEIR
jgi:hypothetical protein